MALFYFLFTLFHLTISLLNKGALKRNVRVLHYDLDRDNENLPE